MSDFDKTGVIKKDSDVLALDLEKAKRHEGCFIVIRGNLQGKRHELSKPRMFIGRDPTADIVLNDQGVSRKHAEIIKSNDLVMIRDNGSTNGTSVNGHPIKDKTVVLNKEDLITVGSTVLKLPKGQLEIIYLGLLEEAAHSDPLTRLYNKGYIMEVMEFEFKRSSALHHDFSVLILDLDLFKRVNDEHGHDAGDYVLREAARILAITAHDPSVMIGRFGGEEFLVLMPNADLEAARLLAESVRSAIAAAVFDYEGVRIPVTVSIGAAEARDLKDSHELFKRADKALYRAKAGGRNRVRTDAEIPPVDSSSSAILVHGPDAAAIPNLDPSTPTVAIHGPDDPSFSLGETLTPEP